MKYIGTKLIEAEPAYKVTKDYGPTMGTESQIVTDLSLSTLKEPKRAQEGYKVKYSDGYVSWSPKDVFEEAYMKVIPNSDLKSDISISQQMVDDFIKETHINTVGDKTTLVRVVLRNGFELVEASACVDIDNYDEKYGAEICLEKIKNKIWCLLGFLLQTAKNGIN